MFLHFIFIFQMFYFLAPPYCYLFSRTAGARWSLRKPEFRVNLGAQVLGSALNSLRFDSCLEIAFLSYFLSLRLLPFRNFFIH